MNIPFLFVPSVNREGVFHTVSKKGSTAQSAIVLYGANVVSPKTFQNCSELTSVYLPDSLNVIGPMAFNQCLNLQDIEIPSDIHEIDEQAFSGCSSLLSLDLPSTLQTLGEKAFSGCTKLSQLYGPHQISQLNENVFENCPELGVVQVFSPDDQKAMSGEVDKDIKTAIILQGTESLGYNTADFKQNFDTRGSTFLEKKCRRNLSWNN